MHSPPSFQFPPLPASHRAAVSDIGVTRRRIELIWTANSFEFVVAGFALSALLVAQWMLSSAIHGTNYDGVDGKMAQATILAAVKFSGLFEVTTISPIEGIGSQLR